MKRGPGRPGKRLLTIAEIQEYPHVGRTTVHALPGRGMPRYRVPGGYRFDLDEVLTRLRGREKR